MDGLLYTVWLSLSCTAGSETFAKLLSKYKTPNEIYDLEEYQIKAVIGSRSKDFNALCNKSLDKAAEVLNFCKTKGIGILTYFDKDYPKSLKEIKNPPVLLYYRGCLPDFNKYFFASIVGSRRITSYGRNNTFTVARDLARAGAVIVSGMAMGIDGVAHAGALSSDMPTIAILGSGIDVCYPSVHLTLAREIVKTGCVMTEYAPGTGPEKQNFPVRNRIISGLSSVTIVMEGLYRSGAILTARHAKEQGKTVYALPGNVGNIYSQAPNLLLRNGAKILTSAYEVVEDFEMKALGKLNIFDLAKNSPIDMFEVLSKYKISCVAQDDEIFRHSKSKRNKEIIKNETEEAVETASEDNGSAIEEKAKSSLSPKVFGIYRKIPIDKECQTDFLVDENTTLRDVMSGLLTLEMLGFVTMLPGDRVKRNIGKK